MIFLYFYVFSGKLSGDSKEWGEFGSYFASITGLLAFIGVLYSISESKKQSKEIAERGVFFEMLKSHKELLASVNYNGKKGIEAFEEYAIKANNYLYLYVTLKVIVEYDIIGLQIRNAKLKEINSEELPKWLKIFPIIIKHFSDLIDQGITTPKKSDKNDLKDIKEYIKNNGYDLDLFYSKELIPYFEKIYLYSLKNGLYKKHYESMSFVANYMYDKEGNYLGQYYRNIYYLLEVISKFDNSKFYSNIFRAHLSNSEVLMLLYNVISRKSTLRVVTLYKDSDIFNNIDYNYVLGCKVVIEKETDEKRKDNILKDFIRELLKRKENEENDKKREKENKND